MSDMVQNKTGRMEFTPKSTRAQTPAELLYGSWLKFHPECVIFRLNIHINVREIILELSGRLESVDGTSCRVDGKGSAAKKVVSGIG